MNTCPICGQTAKQKWDSDTGLSHFVEFPCGLRMQTLHIAPGWHRKRGTYCEHDLDVVTRLREAAGTTMIVTDVPDGFRLLHP